MAAKGCSIELNCAVEHEKFPRYTNSPSGIAAVEINRLGQRLFCKSVRGKLRLELAAVHRHD